MIEITKLHPAAKDPHPLCFAAPFDQFTGTIEDDGTITLSGPQSCTGKPSGDSIALTCTPGTCEVALTRAK